MKSICELLSIKYPIIQGGMGNISNAVLTAAVSEAGGLGTIGCGTMRPEEIETIILETQRRTYHPFALNIALSVNPYVSDLVQLAINIKYLLYLYLQEILPLLYRCYINMVLKSLLLLLLSNMRKKLKQQGQIYW